MTDIHHYGRNRKGITRELKKQVDSWLDSITDKDVRELAYKDAIVTGGSIASMLLGDKVNDYDVYFRTKETTFKVAEYYVDLFNINNNIEVSDDVVPYYPIVKEEQCENLKGEFEDRVVIYCKSAGVASEDQEEYEYFESAGEEATANFAESLKEDKNKKGDKYRPVFLSENAITLSNSFQLVIRFYGEPHEIHDNYDFVHAMNYWDHHKSKLALHPEALEALLSRTLIYRGSLYPIASVFRTKKFIERGWRISAGEQLKMMWQISELDLSDYEVLKEQLTGVDQAYLYQLIQALKDVDTDKINSTYVSEIIDRIFS